MPMNMMLPLFDQWLILNQFIEGIHTIYVEHKL